VFVYTPGSGCPGDRGPERPEEELQFFSMKQTGRLKAAEDASPFRTGSSPFLMAGASGLPGHSGFTRSYPCLIPPDRPAVQSSEELAAAGWTG